MAYMSIAHTSSTGVNVVSNGSAHTKGNYTQGIASTSENGDGLRLYISQSTAAARLYLLDVALGAAASEVVLVPNIHFRLNSTSYWTKLFIPCKIPAGSRVSFRCQDATGGGSCKIAGYVVPASVSADEGFSAAADCINPLAATGTSAGSVTVDAGGTINTFSGTAGNICNANAPIAATHIILTTRDSIAGLVDFLIRVKVNGTVVTPEFYHRGTNGQGITVWHPYVKLDTPIAVNDTVTAEVSCSGNTVGSRELVTFVTLLNLPAASSTGGSSLIGPGGLA